MAEAWPAARFLPALRRGNVMGAIDMGLAPGLLPGAGVARRRPGLVRRGLGIGARGRGRDAAGILGGLADGTMSALVLVGADPVGTSPTGPWPPRRSRRPTSWWRWTGSCRPRPARADVVLPAAIVHERAGTTTNIEGRVTRLGQKLVAPGQCWPDWMIASELAERLGGDLGVESISDLWDEIERLAPRTPVSPGPPSTPRRPATASSPPWPPRRCTLDPAALAEPFDPMATPGIESVEVQGAPPRSGGPSPGGESESTAASERHGANGAGPMARERRAPSAAVAAGGRGAGTCRPPTATRCGWCRAAALRRRGAARGL
jgi:hypothetical protein